MAMAMHAVHVDVCVHVMIIYALQSGASAFDILLFIAPRAAVRDRDRIELQLIMSDFAIAIDI